MILLAAVTAQWAIAQTAAPPPLTTEHLEAREGFIGQTGTVRIEADCAPASGRPTIAYTATGPASGPYPGTYTESGTVTLERVMPANIGVPVVAFHAVFTIDSAAGQVAGTKQFVPSPTSYGICNLDTSLGFPVGIHIADLRDMSYTATITTATATCTTEGTSHVNPAEQDAPGHPNAHYKRFDEFFQTGTTPQCTARPLRPTNKQQCKKGGWRRFTNPSFKNQGQCVAYVNHHDGKGKDDEKSTGAKDKGKKRK
jgi:hypothetical protein